MHFILKFATGGDQIGKIQKTSNANDSRIFKTITEDKTRPENKSKETKSVLENS